jgi:hypothetical protein
MWSMGGLSFGCRLLRGRGPVTEGVGTEYRVVWQREGKPRLESCRLLSRRAGERLAANIVIGNADGCPFVFGPVIEVREVHATPWRTVDG